MRGAWYSPHLHHWLKRHAQSTPPPQPYDPRWPQVTEAWRIYAVEVKKETVSRTAIAGIL